MDNILARKKMKCKGCEALTQEDGTGFWICAEDDAQIREVTECGVWEELEELLKGGN